MPNTATAPIAFLDPPRINTASPPLADDVIWGAEGLAAELGVSKRRASYLLERGGVPAKKIGGKWCLLRSALRNHLRTA